MKAIEYRVEFINGYGIASTTEWSTVPNNGQLCISGTMTQVRIVFRQEERCIENDK